MWSCGSLLTRKVRFFISKDENSWKLLCSNKYIRQFSNVDMGKGVKILGIETSCDDTGIAIVDSTGNILGESYHSQGVAHIRFGGILPTIARQLHRENITNLCEEALERAGLRLRDVDAIATTLKPGLPLSLMIGRNFGKYLSRISNKPFIPIHHMEAHALTARMKEDVKFPFLTLLISGGHCLLAFVESVTEFHRLGQTIDDAPGEAFDKITRRLKLHHLPEYENKSGGAIIELAASKAEDPLQFEFPSPMTHYRDCNFSFSGLKNEIRLVIEKQESESLIVGDNIIPDVYNLCAGFQLTVAKHIAVKTKRAMEFLSMKKLISETNRTLVVSGGVASNNFITKVLNIVCDEMDFRLVRPPPHLCTDNGVMIAWNGIERWRVNEGILRDSEEIEKADLQSRAPLGDDWTQLVRQADIRCSNIKTKYIYPINESLKLTMP